MPEIDKYARTVRKSYKRVLKVSSSERRALHAMVEHIRRKICDSAFVSSGTNEDEQTVRGLFRFGNSSDQRSDDRQGMDDMRSGSEHTDDPRDIVDVVRRCRANGRNS